MPCLDEAGTLNASGGGSGGSGGATVSGPAVAIPPAVGGASAGSGQDSSAVENGSGGRERRAAERVRAKPTSRPPQPETRVLTRLMKRQQEEEAAGVQTRSKRRRMEEAGSWSTGTRGGALERGTKRRAASTRRAKVVKKVQTATGARPAGATTGLGKRSCAAAAGEAQTEHAAKRACTSAAGGVKRAFGADGGAAESVQGREAPPGSGASPENQETAVSFATG